MLKAKFVFQVPLSYENILETLGEEKITDEVYYEFDKENPSQIVFKAFYYRNIKDFFYSFGAADFKCELMYEEWGENIKLTVILYSLSRLYSRVKQFFLFKLNAVLLQEGYV